MTMRKIWTVKEDTILLDGINQGLSYKDIATKLDRNVKSCQNRFYNLKRLGKVDTTAKKTEEKPVSTKPEKSDTRKRWTKEEDNCLRNQMAIHNDCFEDGFVNASRLTGRSIGACKSRWYQYVSIDETLEPVIVMGSKDKQIINRRYFSRPSLIKTRNENWWKKVCCFFGFSKKQ